ncbi:CRAL-TRIO domain-containing protein [Halteromyces radiatus]|uniref:CRAL-TRIO domain-containing protein n=1 Tax=Halteromyces radiatus TaxID=101107 RepID=UPI0022210152|nr:CRAL-TRIO domain-containing protein [Halteromyces radiatus]KAI8084524.1 CRAL-TRIO domain-containing protein [Halteromyces radiatus]
MVIARTDEQKAQAIAELRSHLKGYPPVNDQEGALKQLLSTFEWRKENGIDMYPVATKSNGLPVLYPIRGYLSMPDQNLIAAPGVAESVLRIYRHMVEEIFHYHVGCNEFLHRVIMRDCSKMAGKVINRETVIFDCTGMSWQQFHMPAIQLIRTISDVDQKYYPETLNKLYLVNAPGAFVYVWKIIKGWLDPGTIDKIQILGSDYQGKLLEQIPPENLPSFLGGKCTCNHIPGGCVPSQVLKNVPINIPGDANHKVPTAYNSDIMEKGKTCEDIRGPYRIGSD